MTVKVYIPIPGSAASRFIAPKSGIVGKPTVRMQGHTLVYYEGNLNGACNIVTYEDKLMTAWHRMKVCYPTVATAMIPSEQVIEVGEFDDASKTVSFNSKESRDAVRAYIGEDI